MCKDIGVVSLGNCTHYRLIGKIKYRMYLGKERAVHLGHNRVS